MKKRLGEVKKNIGVPLRLLAERGHRLIAVSGLTEQLNYYRPFPKG